MSRRKSTQEYEKTFSAKFHHWFRGDRDMYLGKVEMHVQEEYHESQARMEQHERDWKSVDERVYADNNKARKLFRGFYICLSVAICVILTIILVTTVSYLPPAGNADNPANNEVAQRYVEQGSEETGVLNTVTGMVLQYRAFDTFGETNVLYIATCAVFILLMAGRDKNGGETTVSEEAEQDRSFEPKDDPILQAAAKVLVPMLFIFGIYILLNGHLSPGGGFSGGAILGSALILYNSAFGFEKTQAFFNGRIYGIVRIGALCVYAVVIVYYFLTGANGIESIVPLGRLGSILGAGLILPINVCVGLAVTCTMYAFYAMFRRGDF